MRSTLSWLFAGAALVAPAAAVASPLQVHSFHQDHVLGSSFDMTVVADSSAAATMAHWAARDEIARLDKVLSAWRPDSEISALNTSLGPMSVSPDLARVIASGESWRADSAGAFSIRLGAVEAAWRQASLVGAAPRAATLAGLAQTAADATLGLDGLRIQRPAGVTLATDGLAKGYIIDAALKAAQAAAPGVRGLMVDIGGDLRCAGASPSGAGWTIGIAAPGAADNEAPTHVLNITDQAVATSGMGRRDRVIGGCAYSHTLSPVDGSAVNTPQVTVVANRAVDADALASALAVMPIKAGLSLIERTPGAQARIVSAGGQVATSSGWTRLLARTTAPALLVDCAAPAAAAPATSASAPTAGKPWPSAFNVTISYTIPNVNDPRHHPFVAIWVTDSAGKMVKTLFHLGQQPERYLDANYSWYNLFQKSTPSLFYSITRPTRAPGKYDVVWDGKDDAGKVMPQGDYVIHVEGSREHGGHSLQDIPIKLYADEATASNTGGGELGATSVSYGKN